MEEMLFVHKSSILKKHSTYGKEQPMYRFNIITRGLSELLYFQLAGV